MERPVKEEHALPAWQEPVVERGSKKSLHEVVVRGELAYGAHEALVHVHFIVQFILVHLNIFDSFSHECIRVNKTPINQQWARGQLACTFRFILLHAIRQCASRSSAKFPTMTAILQKISGRSSSRFFGLFLMYANIYIRCLPCVKSVLHTCALSLHEIYLHKGSIRN